MLKRKLRALIVMLCVPLLAVFAGVKASAAAGFTDVPSNAWYTDAVRDMVNRGIMSGAGDGTFRPGGYLTRADFATMLAHSALPESELKKYNYRGSFTDVKTGYWANPYINWASENGIVKGAGNNKFNPGGRLTRQDMAVMLVNYTKAMGIGIPPVKGPMYFKDDYAINLYAEDAVYACARAGILNGNEGYFKPKNNSQRCDAAQMLSTFLKVGRDPNYKVIRKRVEDVSVAAVEFDPSWYTPDVVMGNDLIDGGENIANVISRTGAKIAVNGGFFSFDTYMPYATIVKNGRLISTYNAHSPAKSTIVMDSTGRFSIEHFTTRVTLEVYNPDGTTKKAENVVVNVRPSSSKDGARIIFTRDWGRTLGFKPKYAVRVDNSGSVVAVYRNQDVDIPNANDGYLIVQQADRMYQNDFITSMVVGTDVNKSVYYEGSETQDIELALGVGPQVVKDGWLYGDASTYNAEGLSGINNFSNDRRVCLGIKPEGHLVLLTANTSLPKLSHVMVSLGCYSAVNLDGGGSSNLYVEGTYYTGPRSRPMNNVIVFK
ncbi:S-layer homology domain-containing protein [Acutalibacter sp. 1XD8-36]|uniref:S-layer homology domain-containing protein n=1 Tax=Acutalibacter sp. 1XD8-36 TaxID=2320852 RepID=UPI002619390B|nr:S-layer homology domain-containing protein [Acutalibacter sp. 1XD8-36]